MRAVAGADPVRHAPLRFFLGALALYGVVHLAPDRTALQLATVALVLTLLVALFLSRPAAFLYVLLASVAAGGVEVDLGMTTPKLFFATVTVVAYVVSVLIRKALSLPGFGRERAAGELPYASSVAVLLLCYLVLLTPTLVHMQLPQRSLYILVMRVVTVLGVVVYARERRVLTSAAPVLLVASLAGSVIALGYIGQAVLVYRAMSFAELAAGLALKDNTVQVGLLGTTNTIASFLAFTLPLGVAHLVSANRRGWERPVAIASVGVQSFGLLATFSRGGAVAVLGGVIIAALVCHTSARQLRRLLGLVALALLLVTVASLVAQDAMRDSFASRFAMTSMNEYIIGRLQLWDSSVRAFLESPMFGIGLGNVGFYDRDFGTGHGSETHNLLLQTLAEEGLAAGLFLFAVLGAVIWQNVRAARKGGSAQLWIVIALISTLINSMIEPTFWVPAFAALFWFSSLFFYRHAATVVGVAREISGTRRAPVRSGGPRLQPVPVTHQ